MKFTTKRYPLVQSFKKFSDIRRLILGKLF